MDDNENYIAYKRLKERYLDLYFNENNPRSKALMYEQYKIFGAKEQQYIDALYRDNKPLDL
jgi:hypothetical protein